MFDNQKFRRQFLLSSKQLEFPDHWVTNKFKRGKLPLYLYNHPDLKVTIVKNAITELILLGYILDVYNPHLDDREILEKLIVLKDFDGIVNATANFNGRFVIIYLCEKEIKVFNDATGFREIYYGNIDENLICGSTSSIIGEYFGVQKSEEGELFRFTQSEIFKKSGNLMIGKNTPYPSVYHLLPNHYLDLVHQKTIRFWPVHRIEKPVIKEAIKEMCDILQRTFEAASSRYALFQGLTSGWDTRLLLAASKNNLENIKFYYNRGFKRDQLDKPAVDFCIACEIAERFQLDFQSIELDEIRIDETFERIYYQNNALARPQLLPVFYDAYLKGLENTITVSGTMGNEILRILFPLKRNTRDSKEILKLLHYDDFPFLEREIGEWMEGAKEPVEALHYNLIDLFNWEQYFGNWGAISSSEQDIVREEIRIFNCRKFLNIYISLPDKYRYRDYPLGHAKMIEEMWGELLCFGMDIQLHKVKKVLRRLGLEILADKVYQKMKVS